MRHTVVERLSLLALALAALSVAGFALAVRPAPGRPAPVAPLPPDPFVTHCESCHERAELRPRIVGPQGSLSPERRAELESFLADHGDANPEDDRRILDELSN